jgi:hypothetical protein
MKNRIANGIAAVEVALKQSSPAEVAKALQIADETTAEELRAYQDIRSLGQASDIITFEESMQMHLILGGMSPTECQWRSRSLAEKLVVMQTIAAIKKLTG